MRFDVEALEMLEAEEELAGLWPCNPTCSITCNKTCGGSCQVTG